MSLFAKHNQLPTTLSGHFSIINLNSSVNVKNSTISQLTPSFVINNGLTLIFNTNVNNSLTRNVVLDTSKNYIDDLQFNTFKYSYIEKSLFLYSPLSTVQDINPLLDSSSETVLLVIPSTDSYKNNKQHYVEVNHRLNFGDGNLVYSPHFLTNKVYGYWGNKYAGEWTSNYNILLTNLQLFNTFITTSPRNLNGHILDVTYIGNDLNNLEVKNFYNGILNLTLSGLSRNNKRFDIQNNNLPVNINFITSTSYNTFNLYDNKDLNIVFEKETASNNFLGDNNYINITFKNKVELLLNLFKNNSWGNKVSISATQLTTLSSYLKGRLDNNNTNCGNYITIINFPEKIDKFINDRNESLQNSELYMLFTINEVHTKKYRDVTDIGTIVGWPAHLPVPRGYYVCDGRLVKVDLNNPNDLFYNGQLAYYLNGNLTTQIIKLPYIPSAIPSAIVTDPNYFNNNFSVRDSSAGIIYIIKYNNNFENKKKGN